MRPAVLLAALLLAGCAGEPIDAPSAPTPPPTGEPAAAYMEEQRGWTLTFDRASYEENYGNAVNVTFRLRAEGDLLDDVRVELLPEWAVLHGDPRLDTPDERFSATVYVGHDERVGVALVVNGDTVARFRGPPLVVAPAGSSLATRQLSNVSDDPAGLSAVFTAPGHVRITYAPPRNATSTADERVVPAGPFHLQLSHFDASSFVTGFVIRSTNDAVMSLPEPERVRVVAEADVATGGTLTIRIVAKDQCFCMPQPPDVETLVVQVP